MAVRIVMEKPDKPSIYGETLETLKAKLKAAGQPAFRATQITQWLYKKRVVTWEDMTNLPVSLRTWLADTFELLPSKILLNKKAF